MTPSSDTETLRTHFRAAIRAHDNATKFYESLEQEDDLGLVLRGHLYVEALLQTAIEARLTKPDALRWRHFRFDAKLDLAVALDAIAPQYLKIFKDLDDLRNNFAHKVDYRLSEPDVDRLLKTFPEKDRNTVVDSFDGPVPPSKKIRIAILTIYLYAWAFARRAIGEDLFDEVGDTLQVYLEEVVGHSPQIPGNSVARPEVDDAE